MQRAAAAAQAQARNNGPEATAQARRRAYDAGETGKGKGPFIPRGGRIPAARPGNSPGPGAMSHNIRYDKTATTAADGT